MTKLPVDSWDFKGLDGPNYPDYKVGPVCAVPGCSRLADHAHHVIRRSALGGAFQWVRMPDQTEIGNITPLCFQHHQDITENRETIHYNQGKYFWSDGRALTTQPPVKLASAPPVDAVSSYEAPDLVSATEPDAEDVRVKCPGCGRPLPKPKIERKMEDKKPRVSWAVGVPVTEQENGADTLDALIEASREEMAKKGWEYGAAKTAKFFVLTHALSMFVLHANEILGDA